MGWADELQDPRGAASAAGPGPASAAAADADVHGAPADAAGGGVPGGSEAQHPKPYRPPAARPAGARPLRSAAAEATDASYFDSYGYLDIHRTMLADKARRASPSHDCMSWHAPSCLERPHRYPPGCAVANPGSISTPGAIALSCRVWSPGAPLITRAACMPVTYSAACCCFGHGCLFELSWDASRQACPGGVQPCLGMEE